MDCPICRCPMRMTSKGNFRVATCTQGHLNEQISSASAERVLTYYTGKEISYSYRNPEVIQAVLRYEAILRFRYNVKRLFAQWTKPLRNLRQSPVAAR